MLPPSEFVEEERVENVKSGTDLRLGVIHRYHAYKSVKLKSKVHMSRSIRDEG